jgi:hypothetical protein
MLTVVSYIRRSGARGYNSGAADRAWRLSLAPNTLSLPGTWKSYIISKLNENGMIV